MSTRNELLESIADTIKDYRRGEIEQPDAAHVEKWVKPYPADVQLPILSELDHVLKHTYLNRDTVMSFLNNLITNAELAGANPYVFWRGVSFLKIQRKGSSQKELLKFFDSYLQKYCGFCVADCGADATTFIYIDDAIFSGFTILNDLTAWIRTSAPKTAIVHVITIALHRDGQHFAKTKIAEAASAANKDVTVKWWRRLEIEDRNEAINNSDVLRPRSLGGDPLVEEYAASLKSPPFLRSKDGIGEHKFFSSEHGRAILEQKMLKAGVKIRGYCPRLIPYQRPLGNMVRETLGFGSMIVTFRNCPNNAPLTFWAGDPCYPLFPRKTN